MQEAASAFSYKKFIHFALEETWKHIHLSPSPLQEDFSHLMAMDGKTELQMLSYEAPKIRLLCSLCFEQSDGIQPPTEKLHQIIARTAMFVSKHGRQSEIVLRVKQGDNPTFGFLMHDNHLHAYFRYLVDHAELLHFDIDGRTFAF